jgi:IS1 family transposase
MEGAKITIEKQELILKCHRWGVPEEGTADIAKVTRATVRLLYKKAAKRAEVHHNNNVQNVDEKAVQLDELHGKLAGSVRWVAAAIGMSSLMILAIGIGQRNQKLADRLLAGVWARCSNLKMVLTDGWSCYYGAIIKAFGILFHPLSKPGRGRPMKGRLRFRKGFLYAQVVKGASKINKRWKLSSVILKAFSGTFEQCLTFIKQNRFGTTIHTAHIERWFGSLRNSLACLRRKSRCPLKDELRLKDKVWLFVSLYNWVLPHGSLTFSGLLRTPAMAAGLASQPLSYIEYILLPVHEDTGLKKVINKKYTEMQSEEMKGALDRTKRPPPEQRIVWKGKEAEEEAA